MNVKRLKMIPNQKTLKDFLDSELIDQLIIDRYKARRKIKAK